MKYNINGTTLEGTQNGTGEVVLFVHGSSSDYRTWENQQAVFSQDFQTITYSRRYHYPNAKIAEGAEYAMNEQLDDLQALIESLEEKPVHLIGHSYGALLCLSLALRQPQFIRSLVLEEPPVFRLFITVPPQPQEILGLLLTRPRTAIAIIQFATTGLNPATAAAKNNDMDEANRIFGSAILGAEAYNNLSAERLEQSRANTIKAELVEPDFLPLDPQQIRQIQIPTLIINGANSPALFHRFMERLDELLPHSRRIIIPAASHIVHEDNVPAYNSAVLAFLEQNAA